jgi:hypothetical protein
MLERDRNYRCLHRLLSALLIVGVVGGCSSIKRAAVDMLAGSLAEGGGSYASDGDPELVREALPFGLKTQESLLEISPDNRDLRMAAARGFAAYAFLLQQEADRLGAIDAPAGERLRRRVGDLFLRGRDHALLGLESSHPGFRTAVAAVPAETLAATAAPDAALLYWAGACWAGALGVRKDDLELLADLPVAAALVQRVIALDEGFEAGAAHEFMVAYEGGRPGGDIAKARRHYERALALSGGRKASVHLALAEGVVLGAQDQAEFERLLSLVRSVDLDAAPRDRLVNAVARRRADWLAGRLDELFLDYKPKEIAR